MKYGKEEDRRMWLKLHLTCGVKTNIVTAVQVSDGYAHDYPYFKPLVEQTKRIGFNMKEISADKGYLGATNMLASLQQGAIPYIPFKINSVPDSRGSYGQSQSYGLGCITSIVFTVRNFYSTTTSDLTSKRPFT